MAGRVALLAVVWTLGAHALPAHALSAGDQTLLDARDAWREHNRARSQATRSSLIDVGHPLAMWADYWDLNNRLTEASAAEVEAFFARWPGSYVEDRLRNDWLLELGRRQDWARIISTYQPFRMRDDREVACWLQLARLKQGESAAAEALVAWSEQRESDQGCLALGQALRDARHLSNAVIWRRLRDAVEAGRTKLAHQAAALLSADAANKLDEAVDNPSRVARKHAVMGELSTGMVGVALARLAANDPAVAAKLMNDFWERRLPAETAAWVWAAVGRQAATRQQPAAPGYFERGWLKLSEEEHPGDLEDAEHFDTPTDRAVALHRYHAVWPDETLAWQARAALRAATDRAADPQTREHRWRQVLQAITAMSAGQRVDAAWTYWRARALLALPVEPTHLAAAGGPGTGAAMSATGRAGSSIGGSTSGAAASASDRDVRSDAASAAGGGATSATASTAALSPSPLASLPASSASALQRADAGSGPLSRGERAREAGRPTTHAVARELLAQLAGPFDFYAQLAAEDVGQATAPLSLAQPVTPQERVEARANPGLVRAVSLIRLGLRSEGVREWNYTISFSRPGGMDERQVLAAAQWACELQIWDRCIHSSERARTQVAPELRYPTPFRKEILEAARNARVDPAYVYGLIRQESRFITQARSGVGASGLMQLMPATAEWTAKKLGIAYEPDGVSEPGANIRLGVTYLKLALDNFGGAQALAAAAYNAGPSRPKRWREGATIDAAAWVENIPFNETRDYVKKVLSNATRYASLLGSKGGSLRARLGNSIGPRTPESNRPELELP